MILCSEVVLFSIICRDKNEITRTHLLNHGFLPTQAEISRIGWFQPGHATRCHKKNILSNSVEPAGFNRCEVELTLYRRTRGNGSPVLEIRLTTRYLFAAVVATSQINLSPLTDTKKAIKQHKTTNNQHKTTNIITINHARRWVRY